MKYFTYEWAMGGGDDDQVVERYREFIGSLDSSNSLQEFALSVSLNDAYVDRFTYDRAGKELTLRLLTGDLQSGYFWTEIYYAGATIDGEDVLTKAITNRPAEIWYDEFDLSDGCLSHGYLLVPDSYEQSRSREFRISFAGFHFEQSPAPGRILPTL